MVPKFNLEKKKTKVENRRQKRKIYRNCKEDIGSQRLETAIERTYGSDISLWKRKKIRLSKSFERSRECKEREKKNSRSHVGSNVQWNSIDCFEEIKSIDDR